MTGKSPGKSIGKAARQIGGITAVSRIFGFVRDIVFAALLGAGPAADAFIVALKLPNMFRRLSAEGAMTNAFVPQFSEEKARNGKQAALFLAAEVQLFLTIALSVLVILAEIFMPAFISLLAPGFADTPDRMAAAITLARLTMPYLPLISLVALFAAISNAHDRFAYGAFMPIIMNFALIAAACFIPFYYDGGDMLRAYPLAIAVLVAGVIQLVVMRRVLQKMDAAPPLMWPRISVAGRRMWKKFLPAAFGAAGMQLNTLVDLILASMLSVGAISWLYFADRVAQLPLGIIGIALGTALLPRLSKAEAENDQRIVPDVLAEAITLGGFFIIPAVAALVILAKPIVLGLFGYGAFEGPDVDATAAALAFYAIGLPAFVLIKILQTAFYASGRPGHVLIISLIMVAINVAGSIILMKPLGHKGLALATSLAAIIAALMMIILLVQSAKLNRQSLLPLWRPALATIVMVAGLQAGLNFIPSFDRIPLGGALHLVVLVGIGGALYMVAARIFGAIPKGTFSR